MFYLCSYNFFILNLLKNIKFRKYFPFLDIRIIQIKVLQWSFVRKLFNFLFSFSSVLKKAITCTNYLMGHNHFW